MDIEIPVPDHVLDDAREEAAQLGVPVANVVAERFTWSWEGEQ